MKLLLTIMILTTALFATPAFKGKLSIKQADGETFQAKIKGDEWFNWIEDDNGNVIKYNNNSKNYEYATLEEKNGELDLIPSGTRVATDLGSLTGHISVIDKDTLTSIWKEKKDKALLLRQQPEKHCH